MNTQEQILKGERVTLRNMINHNSASLYEIEEQKKKVDNKAKGIALDRNINEHIKATYGMI